MPVSVMPQPMPNGGMKITRRYSSGHVRETITEPDHTVRVTEKWPSGRKRETTVREWMGAEQVAPTDAPYVRPPEAHVLRRLATAISEWARRRL